MSVVILISSIFTYIYIYSNTSLYKFLIRNIVSRRPQTYFKRKELNITKKIFIVKPSFSWIFFAPKETFMLLLVESNAIDNRASDFPWISFCYEIEFLQFVVFVNKHLHLLIFVGFDGRLTGEGNERMWHVQNIASTENRSFSEMMD